MPPRRGVYHVAVGETTKIRKTAVGGDQARALRDRRLISPLLHFHLVPISCAEPRTRRSGVSGPHLTAYSAALRVRLGCFSGVVVQSKIQNHPMDLVFHRCINLDCAATSDVSDTQLLCPPRG